MNDKMQEIKDALQNRRTSSIYEAIYRDNHESYLSYLLSEVERLQRENEAMKEALEWTRKRFEEEWTYEPGIGEVVDEIIGRFTQ